MIEGIKLDLAAEELIEHLEGRATYHRERAEFFRSQVDALVRGAQPEDDEEERSFRDYERDPKARLKERTREHDEKAQIFAFMAAHIVPKETYRLDHEDFRRIELVRDRYGGW